MATTDKNDPFLNKMFKHGEKWVHKNGAKCNVGFGRITQNFPEMEGSNVKDAGGYRVVLGQQGASASQITAARFPDTLAKFD